MLNNKEIKQIVLKAYSRGFVAGLFVGVGLLVAVYLLVI